MRKFLLLTASVGAMGLALTAAQAADVIPEAAPPEFNWTAFHVGVGGGGGWNLYDAESQYCADDDADDCPASDASDLVLDLSADDLGAFYGFGTVEAGFDYDFGGFVIGILGNYDFNGNSDADAESNLLDDDDSSFADHTLEAELDDTWFVGGRLGVAVGLMDPRDSLIYVLGGYTWADGNVKSDVAFNSIEGEDGSSEVDEDDSVDGWTIGGGIETMIWEAVSLKVEYRHDFLDDLDFEGEPRQDEDSSSPPDDEDTHDGSVDFSRDTIRAVLSWRFGGFWE
jgi:outer membrane immunogenic protein